jgi:hypothetical protein
MSGRYDPGVTEPALPVLALDGLESVAFVRRVRERGLRTAVVGLDRGGPAAALAERGADAVVTARSDLVLEGAVARGGR